MGSFLKENKKLITGWVDTKMEIYRLRAVLVVSRMAGSILWIIISLVLVSLLIVFGGIVTGFWLSEITGSYTKGFGITAIILLVLILLLAALRKVLFINPIIRAIIKKTGGKDTGSRL